MSLTGHNCEEGPSAPSFASAMALDELMRGAWQCLDNVVRARTAHKQQIRVAMEAITRSRALLAQGGTDRGYAVTERSPSANARPYVPCPPQCRQTAPAADAGDLGREIATAILRLVPDLIDEHGLIFEIADPEPVLRGVASAYAAIAEALPGGRDEAWTLLGLLALELDDAGRPSGTS